jgi:hypothetical protein
MDIPPFFFEAFVHGHENCGFLNGHEISHGESVSKVMNEIRVLRSKIKSFSSILECVRGIGSDYCVVVG